MNKAIKAHYFFLVCALSSTVLLFLIGGQRWASTVFTGHLHSVAHFVTYAIIAAAYSAGIPRANALLTGSLVAIIGGLHEFYEISSHGHPFEYGDFFVNGTGAFIGAFITRIYFAMRK